MTAGVRVGVDVGGTFTKAVAVDGTGAVTARAIVPTTHAHADGVAAGVVEVIGRLVAEVGAGAVELVTHSTTQAVNALLEGDVAPVGVLGMASAPHVRKARSRTQLGRVALSDGKFLRTIDEFIDITAGLDAAAVEAALRSMVARGAAAVCVAEAFAPDDATNEQQVAAIATGMGLPVTTSAELTGLYGLELRTLTGTLNAAILPVALRTAEMVGAGVRGVGVTSPVMVMRGDGGATDLEGFRRAPARTLYSGPAASVAGALRTTALGDAVVVEVGGTSTNVAAIKHGRPLLSYVRVGAHATAIRALDVRVAGVAGGSMLRVRKRKVYAVGPRSAHIAGLPYCSFLRADELAGAVATEVAPLAGDTPDHLVLTLADGRQAALTNTCAANLLGIVEPGDYAAGDAGAARVAFEIAGRHLRLPADEVARRMLAATTQALGDLIASVIADHDLTGPTILAVGGGAGGVGRAVAAGLGLRCEIPPDAEVISSVGDALSLVRAERERTFASPSPAQLEELVAEVEADAIAAGADPSVLDVEVVQLERGAVRAVATGALALRSGAAGGRTAADERTAQAVVTQLGLAAPVVPVGSCWVAVADGRVIVLDRYADVLLEARGEQLPAGGDAATIAATAERHVRHLGPVTVAPTAWLVTANRFIEVGDATDPANVATLAAASGGLIVIGRS